LGSNFIFMFLLGNQTKYNLFMNFQSWGYQFLEGSF
jgi:hypothetical protein